MRAEVVFLDLPARVLHIKEENRKTRIVSHKSGGAALLDWNDKLSDLMHQSQTRYLFTKTCTNLLMIHAYLMLWYESWCFIIIF